MTHEAAQALDDLPLGLLLLDAADIVQQASRAAGELLRCDVATLAGSDYWELLPDDVAEAQQPAARLLLGHGERYSFIVHDRFEARWIEHRLQRRGEGGTLVLLEDVTAREQAALAAQAVRHRADALFTAQPYPMWVLDRESLLILAANPAAAEFYGLAPQAMAGMPARALYADDEAAQHLTLLAAPAWPGGSPTTMRLSRQRRAGGQVALVELVGQPLEWDGARAVLVSATDMTRRSRVDERLRRRAETLARKVQRQEAQLSGAYRELETFIAAMSHDLQSPLHIVDGFAKTLATRHAQALDAQGLHYLSRIQATAQRMSRLVDELRLLSRVPRMAMDARPVDLTPVCVGIMDDLRAREPSRRVDLEITPALTVVGDRSMLGMALTCLLENAWKFTAAQPQGWVKVSLAEAGPDAVRLLVTDNGAGFDMTYRHKLFEPFQRLHSSAEYPGTGLGLAIVRRIVERHGGTVAASSAPGAGATFELTLPLRPGPQPPA